MKKKAYRSRENQRDKKVGELRFKGNQKQFEHNAKLDSVLDRIGAETSRPNVVVSELIREGKE